MKQILNAGTNQNISVGKSNSGHSIPMVNNKSLHSSEDPLPEASQIAKQVLPDPLQQRIIFYGFGFDYHFFPFIKLGFSPIVVEPSIELLKLALSYNDLEEILPYIFFHLGNVIPDVPRGSKVIALPGYSDLYP